MADEAIVAKAAELLRLANRADPGMVTLSLNPERYARERRIADHYMAYGVRTALDELGLLPDPAGASTEGSREP